MVGAQFKEALLEIVHQSILADVISLDLSGKGRGYETSELVKKLLPLLDDAIFHRSVVDLPAALESVSDDRIIIEKHPKEWNENNSPTSGEPFQPPPGSYFPIFFHPVPLRQNDMPAPEQNVAMKKQAF